jgi:hypothetical protein
VRLAILFAMVCAGCGSILGLPEGELVLHSLTVTRSGSGGGSVTSLPEGIDCPPACNASFAQGTEVRLIATANGGSTLQMWSTCTGTGTCDLVVAADATVDAVFSDNSNGNNFVFVTKQVIGIAGVQPLATASRGWGADVVCAADAAAAKLPGTFVAWLSTSKVNAKDRLGTARGWVRPDGRPFADRIEDLVAGKIFFPPNLYASGYEVSVLGASVLTGTGGNGTAIDTCKDWTEPSSPDGKYIGGLAGGTTEKWTQGVYTSCSQSFALYCFGIDGTQAVTTPAATGRLAFVSESSMALSTTGIAAADEICQTEATAAALSGTYKALLAQVGKSAASRFVASRAPWVRIDGVPLTTGGNNAPRLVRNGPPQRHGKRGLRLRRYGHRRYSCPFSSRSRHFDPILPDGDEHSSGAARPR